MAKISDKGITLARVYAGAMLQLAESRGEADALCEELLELGKYLDDHPEVVEFFGSPMVDGDDRAKMIEKTLRGRASDLLTDALQVINRKDRMGLLGEVINQYRLAHKKLRGHVDVFVHSAVPLDEGQRGEIRKVAKRFSDKEPELVESVDPEILGGLVLQIGDLKFDGSIAARLRRLSENLVALGTREIHSGKSLVSN